MRPKRLCQRTCEYSLGWVFVHPADQVMCPASLSFRSPSEPSIGALGFGDNGGDGDRNDVFNGVKNVNAREDQRVERRWFSNLRTLQLGLP